MTATSFDAAGGRPQSRSGRSVGEEIASVVLPKSSARRLHGALMPTSFAAMLLLLVPALAYDDSDCARQETVPVSVDEDFGNWSEMDAARKRALDRTNQSAISQVVGVEVKSSREKSCGNRQ